MEPGNDFIVSVVCLFLMACAAVTDIRTGKIPNALTVPTMIAGVLFHILMSGRPGAFFSLQGLLTGMCLLALPFVRGGMGGGDVKLLGAAGSWIGPWQVGMSGLAGMFIGGLFSLVLMARHTGWRHAGHIPIRVYNALNRGDVENNESRVCFPYALPLAMGYLVHTGLLAWI